MNDRETLQFLLARGFDHLTAIAQSIKKLSEEKEQTDDVKRRMATLTMMFGSINDILHPAYASVKDIFPEHDLSDFISSLEKSYQDTLNQKLFPACKCPHCKDANESPSGNTDQDQSLQA